MTKRKDEKKKKISNQGAESEQTYELKETKNTISDLPSKLAPLFTIIVSFVPPLSRYVFAINAENFYDVPSLYFYDDRIFDIGAMVLFVLVPSFIWFIPFLVKKASKESEFNIFERLLFSIAVALLVLLESLFFSDHFFENMVLFVILSFVLSIISFIGYDLLFFLIARNNANEGTKKCKLKNFYTKHSKAMTVTSGISYTITTVTIFIMTVLLIMRVQPLDPTNQKGFEFISGKESGYRIVVGHYQDSVVLMKGSIKGGKLEIDKDDYRVEPLGERQLEYRHFSKVGLEPKEKD